MKYEFLSNKLKKLMSTEHVLRRAAELMIRNPLPWIMHQRDQVFVMAQPIHYGRRGYFYLCIKYDKEERKYELY